MLLVSCGPFTLTMAKWRGGAEQEHPRAQSRSERLLFLDSWQGGMQVSIALQKGECYFSAALVNETTGASPAAIFHITHEYSR